MRVTICFSIIVFAITHGFAQAPSPADKTVKPSQKEMQAQLKQVKKEAQEQITSLEKDIAAAKANNEDPESIKQMESQLATLRQVLGSVDNINTSNKPPETLPSPKTTEPKYVSPFEPIVLKQPVTAPTKDQAKDQLFWYKGKKIDANTLVTSSKTIVRYDRTKNRLIIQTDQSADSPYYGLLNTLSQTAQMRNDFVLGLKRRLNIFFMYPEIQKAYDDFILFRDRYYELSKNSLQLPVSHEPLEVLHHALIQHMATLPSPKNVPSPPKRPNNLCDCSGNERKQYEFDLAQWREPFAHEENGLLNDVEIISLTINNGGQGYAALARSLNIQADITQALDLVLDRLTQKVEELISRYQSPNVYIEDGLVMATKYLQKIYFQIVPDAEEQSTINLKRKAWATMEKVKSLIVNNVVFEKYVEDQKAARNFNAVLEYSLYESHEMNKKALKRTNDVEKNISEWLDKLDRFNRFSLSMKLDFEYVVGDDDDVQMDATGQLQSVYRIVALGRDDCGWHLSLKDPDHTDRSGNEEDYQIPFNVLGGSKFIKNIGTFAYTGPGKMNMIYPVFKIDLCPNTNDSVYLEGLRYGDADLAAHSHDDFAKVYTTDMFQYVNKMFVMIKKVEDNSANIISSAVNMTNISKMTPRPPSTGNATLDQFMMEYLMYKKKGKMLQNVSQSTHTGQTVVVFDAQNNGQDPVFITVTKSLIAAADQDQNFKIKMKSANLTIEVTHSPL